MTTDSMLTRILGVRTAAAPVLCAALLGLPLGCGMSGGSDGRGDSGFNSLEAGPGDPCTREPDSPTLPPGCIRLPDGGRASADAWSPSGEDGSTSLPGEDGAVPDEPRSEDGGTSLPGEDAATSTCRAPGTSCGESALCCDGATCREGVCRANTDAGATSDGAPAECRAVGASCGERAPCCSGASCREGVCRAI